MHAIEIFGIFASVVIALSLMMKNVKRLRFVNLAGSLFFALYGLGIGSMPVFLVNCFCVGIDAWYLYKMKHERDDFSLLHSSSCDSDYLNIFLSFHKKDIAKFSPSFMPDEFKSAEAVFVLRDTVPAALVVYRERGEAVFDILLDYAAPAFRDYRNAEFFFSVASRDIAGGKEARFYARSSVRAQVKYLKRLGFVATGESEGDRAAGKEYVKSVRP
jgi:hypothetical protein